LRQDLRKKRREEKQKCAPELLRACLVLRVCARDITITDFGNQQVVGLRGREGGGVRGGKRVSDNQTAGITHQTSDRRQQTAEGRS
jgi:hypothetical protein